MRRRPVCLCRGVETQTLRRQGNTGLQLLLGGDVAGLDANTADLGFGNQADGEVDRGCDVREAVEDVAGDAGIGGRIALGVDIGDLRDGGGDAGQVEEGPRAEGAVVAKE